MTATIIRGRFPARPREVERPDPVAIAERKFADAQSEWDADPCAETLMRRLYAHLNLLQLRDCKSFRQAWREARDDAERERNAAFLTGFYRGDPSRSIDDLDAERKEARCLATDGGAA